MNQGNQFHLPFLDGIRGGAILAVFLYHCIGAAVGHDEVHLPWNGLFRSFDVSTTRLVLFPASYGFVGVAVFFVVSGFCIHLSHQRSKDQSWSAFASRRFFRIYPPYLLAVCCFFFLWPWGSFAIENSWRATQLVSHLFAIHNAAHRTLFGINASFWSIAVELQLYAIYPLLLFFQRRFDWKKTLIVVGFIEFSIRSAMSVAGVMSDYRLPSALIYSPFAFWFSWSMGAYLCECFRNGTSSRLFKVRFDLVAIAAFSAPLFKLTDPFTFPAFALLTAVAIERLITEQWKLPSFPGFAGFWSHLSLLGVVSYSFYLFHHPFVAITGRILNAMFPAASIHPLLLYLACLSWYPLILALSCFLYRKIELPSTHLGRFLSSRMKRPKSVLGDPC